MLAWVLGLRAQLPTVLSANTGGRGGATWCMLDAENAERARVELRPVRALKSASLHIRWAPRLPKRVYTGKTKQGLKVGGERKEFSLWTQNTCWGREYRHCSEGNTLRFISASFLKTATCREIGIMSLIISISGKEEGCTFHWEDSVNLTF